jgi:hypothetical protein
MTAIVAATFAVAAPARAAVTPSGSRPASSSVKFGFVNRLLPDPLQLDELNQPPGEHPQPELPRRDGKGSSPIHDLTGGLVRTEVSEATERLVALLSTVSVSNQRT